MGDDILFDCEPAPRQTAERAAAPSSLVHRVL